MSSLVSALMGRGDAETNKNYFLCALGASVVNVNANNIMHCLIKEKKTCQ
jgi:hypothetical protein